jgi:hypothetical protein
MHHGKQYLHGIIPVYIFPVGDAFPQRFTEFGVYHHVPQRGFYPILGGKKGQAAAAKVAPQNNDRFGAWVKAGDSGGGNGPRKKPSRVGGDGGARGMDGGAGGMDCGAGGMDCGRRGLLGEILQETGYFTGISWIPAGGKGAFS